MSFDDAVAALETAVESDTSAEANQASLFRPAETVFQQAPAESAPQGESAPTSAAPQTPAAPVAPEVPAAAPVDTFDGGKFNPDTLPDELKPAWHQLQAAFTTKTQEVAAQRQQLEGLGDINQITQAAQLYQQLQDPQNWPRFQQEITELMERNGIQPPAPVAAPQAPAPAQQQAADPQLNALVEQYPELAPFAQTLQQQQDMIQQLTGTVQAREEAIRQEAQQMAAIGEFQRQEAILRSDGRNDADMSHIYDLAHAHNGNLLAAAQAYDTMKDAVLSSYLQSKSEAAGNPAAPIAGTGMTSSAPRKPQSLEEAGDIAIETLKAAGLDTLDW